ncbi:SDR family NAD(P)-dependent oxidoreductase, partial [Paracoccaceae bacterium]|nr:SDR family NAD(P)-dependent oxidoreductase [Paracoccaceae bacterium]
MVKELVCSKETLQKDLSGKIYIVTGTTSGIGLATVKQLARQSATIICASRNVELAKKISAEIIEETSNKKLHNLLLKLDSLASVRDFINVFNKKFSRLDGLVNNAAVMNTPHKRTKDGFELQFGVNFLGHFLLTELLLPKLKKAKGS